MYEGLIISALLILFGTNFALLAVAAAIHKLAYVISQPLILSMADRIHKQSELLSKKAERHEQNLVNN